MTELYEQLRIKFETIKSGPHKDMGSSTARLRIRAAHPAGMVDDIYLSSWKRLPPAALCRSRRYKTWRMAAHSPAARLISWGWWTTWVHSRMRSKRLPPWQDWQTGIRCGSWVAAPGGMRSWPGCRQ